MTARTRSAVQMHEGLEVKRGIERIGQTTSEELGLQRVDLYRTGDRGVAELER